MLVKHPFSYSFFEKNKDFIKKIQYNEYRYLNNKIDYNEYFLGWGAIYNVLQIDEDEDEDGFLIHAYGAPGGIYITEQKIIDGVFSNIWLKEKSIFLDLEK